MTQTVRIILFTTNESEAPGLRRAITALPRMRIAAELDEPSLLSHAVAKFPCDLIIADLDPAAPVVIECLRQLCEAHPTLPIFALSKQTEGDVVLRAMKAGIREFLVKPLDVDELEQATSKAVTRRTEETEPGKLISIMGSAGGVGCTMLATNLAVELADLTESEHRVAIVDLDFRFGHVATLFDVQGQHTVADLCSTQEELDRDMVLKALTKHETGVYVLRRPHTFAQAEMITAAHCANVLTTLQALFEYVVVDGPTRHDPGGRCVLDAADFNLMVLQLLVTSVRNMDRMVQELGAQGFNTERVSFVCNRLGRESAYLEVSQVETILNRKFFAKIVDDWKNASASINIGQPLKTYCEKAKIRQDIRAMAMRIHDPQTAQDAARQGGLFSKLFGKTADAKGTEPKAQLA